MVSEKHRIGEKNAALVNKSELRGLRSPLETRALKPASPSLSMPFGGGDVVYWYLHSPLAAIQPFY